MLSVLDASYFACMQDLSKAGLMGFCDVSPGSDKALRVLFFHKSQPFAATLLDLVSCKHNLQSAQCCKHPADVCQAEAQFCLEAATGFDFE